LLTGDDHAKWADLGVAQTEALLDANETTFAEHNTKDRYWCSPEEARGQPGTVASDIFSFGLVLWQLVTCQEIWSSIIDRDIKQVLAVLSEGRVFGVLLFDDDEQDNHQSDEHKAALNAWKKLVHDCWQSNPQDRPTAADLVKRLKTLAPMMFAASQTGWCMG
jgi:serine/threonine protein kinase